MAGDRMSATAERTSTVPAGSRRMRGRLFRGDEVIE
jgi:hypothetical protein